MTVLLHARLLASQDATPETVAIDRAVETAIHDLRRVERGIVWGKNPPAEFTVRRVEAICSRLLEAAQAHRLSIALSAPDLPSDCERGE